MSEHAAPLAMTMGDPAGIGPEITLKAWQRASENRSLEFMVIGPADLYEDMAARLNLAVPIQPITRVNEVKAVFPSALPILDIDMGVPVDPGKADPAHAPAVIASIDKAVELTLAGQTSAVVTNPITKAALYNAGFKHPGHTEYLAAVAARLTRGPEPQPIMMLAAPDLRVVPVTVHIPLRRVPSSLSTERIVRVGRIVAGALRSDFGITAPRLAVSGLNPHAGEDGALGHEDRDIIAPAIRTLETEGIRITGPLPADTMFHAAARERYDAAICMYHDQALVPLKTLDFDRGVNVTLGLPFIRTSPDHGTAHNIAGTGTAREGNLLCALDLALKLAGNRIRRDAA